MVINKEIERKKIVLVHQIMNSKFKIQNSKSSGGHEREYNSR